MGKVDSHIDGKVYKEGIQTPVDKCLIRLNMLVDVWTGTTIEQHMECHPQYMYPESGAMSHMYNNRFIYGDIRKVVTEDINQNKMIK